MYICICICKTGTTVVGRLVSSVPTKAIEHPQNTFVITRATLKATKPKIYFT